MKRLLAALLVALAACTGDTGPTGPQGPAGPQGEVGPAGPQGPGLVSMVFESAITDDVISTPVVQAGDAVPGVVCYIEHGNSGVWQLIAANIAQNNTCAVVEDGGGYRGAAVVDWSLVNSGWRVRIILFWAV